MIKISSDINPFFSDELDFNSYASKQLLSLLYEPFLIEKKAASKKIYEKAGFVRKFKIDKLSKEIRIFFLGNAKWSNGNTLLPLHYKNYLDYLIRKESCLLHYFSFIDGITEVMEGEDITPLVHAKPDILTIQYAFLPPHLNELLSTTIWIPMYRMDDISHTVTTGKYSIKKRTKDYILLEPNSLKYESIKYTIIKDTYQPIKEFQNGEIDLTCCTYFPFREIENFKKCMEFNEEISNIQYVLHYNSKKIPLLNDKKNRKTLFSTIDTKKIEKILYNGVISWKCFFPIGLIDTGENITYKHQVYSPLVIEQPVTLKYSDYYPNGIIAEEVRRQLIKAGIFKFIKLVKCSFDELVTMSEHNHYELLLDLIYPYYNHWFASAYSYLYYLDGETEEQYVKLLNDYIKRSLISLSQNIYYYMYKINDLLLDEIPFIPLLNAKHLYLKKSKLSGFTLNENGELLEGESNDYQERGT